MVPCKDISFSSYEKEYDGTESFKGGSWYFRFAFVAFTLATVRVNY